MRLKDLMRVLPAYTTVHVHGSKGSYLAYRGNPRDFCENGLHKAHAEDIVLAAVPIDSYAVEITVKETE